MTPTMKPSAGAMKALPRYRPKLTKIGCAEHNDPNCLCDVVVTNPVEIKTDIEHRFWDLALRELGDDTVSDRNVYEFFQIVLGLEKLERMLDGAQESRVSSAVFDGVDEHVISNLLYHAKVGSPRHIAQMELEGSGLNEYRQREILERYVNICASYARKDRDRGDRPLQWSSRVRDPEAVRAARYARRRERARARAAPGWAAEQSMKNRARAARRNRGGKSWLDAKRTGGTVVPMTRELIK